MSRVAFGIIVGAILPLGACRQIVGIEDSPQTNIVTTAGGIEFGTSSCAGCAQKNCVAPATACSQVAPCAEYEDCLGTCKGDADCRAKCTADHRFGVGSTTELSKLSSCLASNCEADCNLGCGEVAAYFITPPASADRARFASQRHNWRVASRSTVSKPALWRVRA